MKLGGNRPPGDNNLVHKVMDYNLFRQARDLADQLKPVAVTIDKAQRDSDLQMHAGYSWIYYRTHY